MKSVLDVQYDPERQRSYLYSGNDAFATLEMTTVEVKRALIGRMRWQVLYGESLFLTYSQLLDGAFFNVLRPNELANELIVPDVVGGLVLPFEVNTRDGDLAGSLRRMVTGGFLYASMPAGTGRRHKIREQLEVEASEAAVQAAIDAEGDVLTAVDLILSRCSELDGLVRRRMVERWGAWLAAEKDGMLRVRPSIGVARYDRAYARWPIPALSSMRTESGRMALEAWRSGSINDSNGLPLRTSMYAVLKPLHVAASTSTRHDAAVLKDEFDLAYNRAIAMGEGCGLAYVDELPLRDQKWRQLPPRTTRTVIFPNAFELRLGSMRADDWRAFVGSAQGAISGWWAEGKVECMQEIADRLRSATPNFRAKAPISARPWQVNLGRVGKATGNILKAGAYGYMGSTGGPGTAAQFGVIEAATTEALVIIREGVDKSWLRKYRGRYDIVDLPDDTGGAGG